MHKIHAKKSVFMRVAGVLQGRLDTDMQVQMRTADSSDFPDHASFLELKANGSLTSPDEAARRLLTYLAQPDFGANPVADVRG